MRSRPKSLFPRSWVAAVCLALAFAAIGAQAEDLKFEAFLVWATNAEKSPNPNHKPVNAEVRKKLHELPLKWKNFFEVNRKIITAARGGVGKAGLSPKCTIQVKDLGGTFIQVSLIGRGKRVLKRTQPLPPGEMLVLGGNAPDETGWLVALKRIK